MSTSPVIIFADFQNTDAHGRVCLNTNGFFKDVETKNIKLIIGLEVVLSDYTELSVMGILEIAKEEQIWVARITEENFNYRD